MDLVIDEYECIAWASFFFYRMESNLLFGFDYISEIDDTSFACGSTILCRIRARPSKWNKQLQDDEIKSLT